VSECKFCNLLASMPDESLVISLECIKREFNRRWPGSVTDANPTAKEMEDPTAYMQRLAQVNTSIPEKFRPKPS
jgi:hypothetical protein